MAASLVVGARTPRAKEVAAYARAAEGSTKRASLPKRSRMLDPAAERLRSTESAAGISPLVLSKLFELARTAVSKDGGHVTLRPSTPLRSFLAAACSGRTEGELLGW